jgi:prolyl-tRNA synthetase
LRLSRLFGRTLREAPADADMISHQLLLRAGLIRPLATGIFSYLPLGWRTLRKIEQILREEMDRIGCQEVHLPVVQPAELWQRTGRWQEIGPELAHFRDRNDRDLVLAMTHEEVVADLLRQEVHSYRDLPCAVYQIQTKFRDEPRSRGGLVRVREFTMKDAYSGHADSVDLDEFYPQMYRAYERVFSRCGLQVLSVEADTGMMGGAASHEFMVLNDQGEDTLVLCPACGYAANREQAIQGKRDLGHKEHPAERLLAQVEAVATPDCKTIAQVAGCLGVPVERTLKAVLYASGRTGEVIFVVIRGDLEVNETKLAHVLGGEAVRPATEEELAAAGIVAGYASPVGLRGLRVVADDSITMGTDFVAGANREGYHLVGVNYPRDFGADLLVDIALAQEGQACAHCAEPLEEHRGIEVGHLFKLGTRYSEKLEATFLDGRGQSQPVVMGSYGIGLGRLLAAIVEQHHDAQGIIWPWSVAPYHIHLLSLGKQEPVIAQAEAMYQQLLAAGADSSTPYEVLYDDRSESAGVKFNDADLIGLPLRLTVSRRTVSQGAVEWKLRCHDERELVPLDGLAERLARLFSSGAATQAPGTQVGVEES